MLKLAKMLVEADLRFGVRLFKYVNKSNKYSFIRSTISNILWYAIDADTRIILWIKYKMVERGLN